MTKKQTTREFKEGQAAAKNGGHVVDNPYKTLTAFDHEEVTKYKDWIDGFLIKKGYTL